MTADLANNASIRARPWGAGPPRNAADARDRLLQSAERCYATYGPSRTKMTHIAREAGIHRTTLYTYFADRDAVLAASFSRAVNAVVSTAAPCFATDETFFEQLVKGCVIGLRTARESKTLKMLTAADELARTRRIVGASDVWRRHLQATLGRRIATALAAGELRADVPPAMIGHWISRICFSLVAEPGRAEFGADEGLLRAFLVPALRRRPQPSTTSALADDSLRI